MTEILYPCPIALKLLKEGNEEHIQRIKHQSGRDIIQEGVTEPGQRPYAAILSCADSRVIPERILLLMKENCLW